MVIVAGVINVEPTRREDFLKARQPGIQATRLEKGCLDYVLTPDADDPGAVRLFERWETADDLAAHLAAINQRGAPDPQAPTPLSADIQRYEIATFGPLRG
jgi:quinol monooxygenase YgiN